MQFLSFERDGKSGLAVRTVDGTWHGFADGEPGYPGNLDDLVRGGTLAEAGKALQGGGEIDAAAVKHVLPFRRASKVLCVGLNYGDHAAESGMDLPEFPTVFVRFNSNLVANGAPIVRPHASGDLDYEGELVAVIGKPGRGIAKADALDHVAGYTIFNDGSIRDFQLRVGQWTIGKNFDDTGALGSVFVTADELPKGASGLKIQTRLNGEVMQDSNTEHLIFDVAELVHQLSIGMTLEAGDMIVTGTPSGVGAARTPKVFMKPGDVCEVEIESIGILRNPVRAEA